MQSIPAQFFSGPWTDATEAQSGERAGILPPPLKTLHKRTHAIHTREHEPLIPAQVGQRGIERLPTIRRDSLDHRILHRFRAVFGEQVRELTGLFTRSRHEDPPPEERFGFEPV